MCGRGCDSKCEKKRMKMSILESRLVTLSLALTRSFIFLHVAISFFAFLMTLNSYNEFIICVCLRLFFVCLKN